MKPGFVLASLGAAAALLGAGCAGRQTVAFRPITFAYPSAGAGGQPVLAEIQLLPGEERTRVSRAIVQALENDFQRGIETPKLPLGEPLPEGEKILSQYVSVPEAQIAEHNRQHADLALDTGYFYRLAYEITYKLAEREILLRAAALLQRRAGAGAWRDASQREYSSTFFVGPLQAAIRERLGLTRDVALARLARAARVAP